MKKIFLILLALVINQACFGEERKIELSLYQGSLNHFGEIYGSTGEIKLLGAEYETLTDHKGKYYRLDYLTSSQIGNQKAWFLSTGGYLYLFGETEITNPLDIRAGLSIGFGKYEVSNVHMNGIYYEKVSSYVGQLETSVDCLMRVDDAISISVGGKLYYGVGLQDINWTFNSTQFGLGLNYHF
jgi:hypothetical protein